LFTYCSKIDNEKDGVRHTLLLLLLKTFGYDLLRAMYKCELHLLRYFYLNEGQTFAATVITRNMSRR